MVQINKYLSDLRTAIRYVESKNYSSALTSIYNAYSFLYQEKRAIIQKYPYRSNKQIAAHCDKDYMAWREAYGNIDITALPLLLTIEKDAIQTNKKYETLSGDNLLNQTLLKQRHCERFARLAVIKNGD